LLLQELRDHLIDQVFKDLTEPLDQQDIQWLDNFFSNLAKTFNSATTGPSVRLIQSKLKEFRFNDVPISIQSFCRIWPGLKLKNKDGTSTTTNGWINDELLEGVCLLIMNEHKIHRDAGLQHAKFVVLGTKFQANGMETALKMYEGLNIDNEDIIFVPIHVSCHHWTLIIVDQRNPSSISIDYVDHLFEEINDEREVSINYVKEWHQKKTNMTNLTYKIGEKEEFLFQSLRRQRDNISCAFFVVLGILLFSQDAQWPDDSMLNPANFQLLRRKIAIRILKNSWVADSSTTSLVPEVLDLTADSLAADSSTDIIAITGKFLVIPRYGVSVQATENLQVIFFLFVWYRLEDADGSAMSAYADDIKDIVESKINIENISKCRCLEEEADINKTADEKKLNEEKLKNNIPVASKNISFVNKHDVLAFVETLAKLTVTNGVITTRELKSMRATIRINAQKFELRYSCVLFAMLTKVFEDKKWTPICGNLKDLAENFQTV
jgi:hypothetical protein